MRFKELLQEMIHHDLGFGFFVKDGAPRATFKVVAKSEGVLCGTIFIPTILEIVDREFFLAPLDQASGGVPVLYLKKRDGDTVKSGDVVAEISGNAEVLLKAERTICNILSRLSGIATATHREVEKLAGTSVVLLDTRKDNPFEREMNKYAIRVGGGKNHRSGFYDGVLVKDNDITVYGGVTQALNARAAEARFLTRVEIEVDTLERLQEVLADGRADAILLDNMPPSLLMRATAMIMEAPQPYLIEASGIGSYGLEAVAASGVTAISTSSLVTRGEGNPLDISMKAM